MKLSTVYELVQQDLSWVEEQFKLLVDSQADTFPELGKMLSQVLIGGKLIRPTLTLLAGKLYNYNPENMLLMATACELMHIATLVHDDAIDKAGLRRGRPTINRLWGVDRAVLLGDYLFARAGEFAAATGNLRVVRLFTQTLGTISRAELRQGFSSFSLEQTLDQYIERIWGKTAALFVMATESGAVLSQATEAVVQALKSYGSNLGIAFQIVDDVLDFVATEEELGKPVASDLVQGTLTLPSLLILKRFPEDNPVKMIFQNRNRQEEIKRAIELVRSSGVAEECYQIASDYSTRACLNLNLLPDSPHRQALLALANYVVERKQ